MVKVTTTSNNISSNVTTTPAVQPLAFEPTAKDINIEIPSEYIFFTKFIKVLVLILFQRVINKNVCKN